MSPSSHSPPEHQLEEWLSTGCGTRRSTARGCQGEQPTPCQFHLICHTGRREAGAALHLWAEMLPATCSPLALAAARAASRSFQPDRHSAGVSRVSPGWICSAAPRPHAITCENAKSEGADQHRGWRRSSRVSHQKVSFSAGCVWDES